jgi:acylphosphatase
VFRGYARPWDYAQIANYAMIGAMNKDANQSGTNEPQELHATVRGRVQGVGFRYFVVQKAASLGLRGFARNLHDGDVEVVAQGEKPALERLLALLWQGPSAAYVSHVETAWREPTEHFSGFHARW